MEPWLRWRLIPAGLCALLGGGAGVYAIVILVLFSYHSVVEREFVHEWLELGTVATALATAASLWLSSSVCWIRGRWWRALALSAAGFVVSATKVIVISVSA